MDKIKIVGFGHILTKYLNNDFGINNTVSEVLVET